MSRMDGFSTWLYFGLWYALVRVYFRDARFWQWAHYGLLGISCLVALSALFQKPLAPVLGLAAEFLESNRLSGVIGNPAFLGSFLLMPTVWALAFFVRERLWPARIFAIIVFAVDFFALYTTQTRSAALGLTAALVFFFVVVMFGVRETRLRLRFVVPVGLCIIVFLGVVGYGLVVPRSDVAVRLPRLLRFEDLLNPASADSGRLWAWGSAVAGIRERFLLGFGPGNFDYPFDVYYDRRFYTISFAETTWDKPHNLLLEMGVDAGLLGMLAGFLLFGGGVYVLLRNGFGALSTRDRFFWFMMASGLFGYGVNTLFLFETSNTMLLLFYLFAFGSWQYGTAVGVLRVPLWFFSLYRGVQKVAGGLFVISLVVGVFMLWSLYGRLLISRALVAADDAAFEGNMPVWKEQAQKVLVLSGRTYDFDVFKFLVGDFDTLETRFNTDNVVVKEAMQELSPAILAWLNDMGTSNSMERYVPFYLWTGHTYIFLGDVFHDNTYYAQAEAALMRGHALAPDRQDVAYFLARALLAQKKFTEALAVHRDILIKNPTVGEPEWLYGLALIAAGNRQAGMRFAYNAVFHYRVVALNKVIYLAELYAQEGAYDIMIDMFERLLTIGDFSRQATPYARLAALYAQVGQREKALQYLERAVMLDPTLQAEAEAFLSSLKANE